MSAQIIDLIDRARAIFTPPHVTGHAMDGTVGRPKTAVGRSPRARLHAELLLGR
jgi:hypothetical protein